MSTRAGAHTKQPLPVLRRANPRGDYASALWEVVDLPGLMLESGTLFLAYGQQRGWRFFRHPAVVLGDQPAHPLVHQLEEQLRDQVFPTRREALQALAAMLELKTEGVS